MFEWLKKEETPKLTKVVNDWDLDNITDFTEMFKNCKSTDKEI